jgi:hypothetical protein
MARNIAAEGDFLVRVEGIEGYFTTLSGGQTPVETNQVFDGGADYPSIVVGKKKPSNITVTRPFDPSTDQDLCHRLRRQMPWTTTVTKQPLLQNKQRIADPTVYPGAILVNVTEPDANYGSGTTAMMQLEFAVSQIA